MCLLFKVGIKYKELTKEDEKLMKQFPDQEFKTGEFTVVNHHLVQDLMDIDLWNEDTKDRLLFNRGSVQNIKGLPKFMKEIYSLGNQTKEIY